MNIHKFYPLQEPQPEEFDEPRTIGEYAAQVIDDLTGHAFGGDASAIEAAVRSLSAR